MPGSEFDTEVPVAPPLCALTHKITERNKVATTRTPEARAMDGDRIVNTFQCLKRRESKRMSGSGSEAAPRR